MIWDENEEYGAQQGRLQRTSERNVIRHEQQRQRLCIYRVGVARMRAAMDEGVPPVQAAWRASCQMNAAFALGQRDSGLLVGSIVAAAREE